MSTPESVDTVVVRAGCASVPEDTCFYTQVVLHWECGAKKNMTEPNQLNGNGNVRHPGHYNHGRMEAWDWMEIVMTEDELRGFFFGNALKYLYRYRHKGTPQEDLEKAQNYLKKLILMEREDESTTEGEESPVSGGADELLHDGPDS